LKRIAPQIFVFLIEQILCGIAISSSIAILKLLSKISFDGSTSLKIIIINQAICIAFTLVYKTYKDIIRFSEIRNIFIILLQVLSSLTFWFALLFFIGIPVFGVRVPYSMMVVNATLSVTFIIAFRVIIIEVYFRAIRNSKKTHNIIIYGAGDIGIASKKAIEMNIHKPSVVAVYIDDNIEKIGKNLGGINVEPANIDNIDRLIKKYAISEITIATSNLMPEKKIELAELCSQYDVKLSQIPPLSEWMDGIFRSHQLKEVSIEMLLQRPVISLFNKKTSEELNGKTVLITGAAGSIGSEITRQLANYPVKKLVLLDQSESGIFELMNEMKISNPHLFCAPELATVREKNTVEKIMLSHKPDIVFHAAAYKHVPLLEMFPSELIRTNVLGTMNVAVASLKANVNKFVMISTDKAVNPTNLMGASKRIAEIYIQELNAEGKMKCITTRFGNVLGSNGSVVPTFRKQIESGGPVTVTHPEITRYFMTIPEASMLVLEAATMGKGDEIFVFDMGEPVRIVDLAKRMIMLAGLIPEKDIEINYTGLRAGEKLYEELFKDSETLQSTHHPKIMVAKKSSHHEQFIENLNELREAIENGISDEVKLISLIKRLIPEYQENNNKSN
jgi:FlaA1/EpsC-like NDP-sugar epimerase